MHDLESEPLFEYNDEDISKAQKIRSHVTEVSGIVFACLRTALASTRGFANLNHGQAC